MSTGGERAPNIFVITSSNFLQTFIIQQLDRHYKKLSSLFLQSGLNKASSQGPLSLAVYLGRHWHHCKIDQASPSVFTYCNWSKIWWWDDLRKSFPFSSASRRRLSSLPGQRTNMQETLPSSQHCTSPFVTCCRGYSGGDIRCKTSLLPSLVGTLCLEKTTKSTCRY